MLVWAFAPVDKPGSIKPIFESPTMLLSPAPLVQVTLSSMPPDLVAIIRVGVELSEQASNFDLFTAVNEFP